MKAIFKTLTLGLAVLLAASCSEEQGNSPDNPSTGDARTGVYSKISFTLPKTRSEASEGNEEARPNENNVGSILVILATRDAETAPFKYLTYALNDGQLTGEAGSNHTVVFQDKEALYNQHDNTVYIFAICNPTEAIRTKILGTLNPADGTYSGGMALGTEFTDEICSLADGESIWSPNGFLMTSVDVLSKQLPSEAELRKCNTPEKALNLGKVEVLRVANRFDFRDASPSDTPALTYEIRDENGTPDADGKRPLVASLTLTRAALFNLRQEFYYFPRTLAETEGATPVVFPGYAGMEDGYVVTPATRSFSENCPARIDPLNVTEDLKWRDLSAVLGDTEDDDNGWGETIDPAADKLGYHIWRYGTENTWLASDEATPEGTTGYVFEAQITPAENFGNLTADGKLGTMYLFADKLYGSPMAIAAEVERVPVSRLATAFYAAFDVTKSGNTITAATPKDDSVVEANGFTIYKPTSDDPAKGKYLCYYFANNTHNDNNDPTTVGPMEFATVRNNVYKLAVTSIKRFGSFKPSEQLEDWDTYFKLEVESKPWTVRVNNIDF